jgi:hypothetical protein
MEIEKQFGTRTSAIIYISKNYIEMREEIVKHINYF